MATTVTTWKDIPIEDIGPMLKECNNNNNDNWKTFWWGISSRVFSNSGTRFDIPGPRSLMVYWVTVCIVASNHDRKENFNLEKIIEEYCVAEVFPPFQDIFNTPNEPTPYEKSLFYIKKLLSCIVDPQNMHPNILQSEEKIITDAETCYQQIVKLVSEQTTQMPSTLGDMLRLLVKQNLEPTEKQLEKELEERSKKRDKNSNETITVPSFYQIWQNWQNWRLEKIKAFPNGVEVLDRLKNGVKQIIFNGAPGTGKSYLSELLANYLGETLPKEDHPYVRVQFHPSYDYTDFVEGLRPVEVEVEDDNGKKKREMHFVKLDGNFKAFCRRVALENQQDEQDGIATRYKKYFFLIDEINRADLSKVFGELMFCLEADKRGPDHTVHTQYQNLPTYGLEKKDDIFAEGFYIPENVYIIGTMNDIDRSVESMDFALRRRFEFIELKVDYDSLVSAFMSKKMGFSEDDAKSLAESVAALNKKIETGGVSYGLNKDYFISQGQFAHLPDNVVRTDLRDVKKYVWTYRIEPLLREYLRGEPEEKIKEFVENCRTAGNFPEVQPEGHE